MSEDAPHYGPMNEQRAREILGEGIAPDGLRDTCNSFVWWNQEETDAVLDGHFTAEELEAIAWWMRNKQVGNV